MKKTYNNYFFNRFTEPKTRSNKVINMIFLKFYHEPLLKLSEKLYN